MTWQFSTGLESPSKRLGACMIQWENAPARRRGHGLVAKHLCSISVMSLDPVASRNCQTTGSIISFYKDTDAVGLLLSSFCLAMSVSQFNIVVGIAWENI